MDLNYGIWFVINFWSIVRLGGVCDESGNCQIRSAVIIFLSSLALVRYTMNCVGIFWTLLQLVILVILSLFVPLLSMLYYMCEYNRLSVVITCCVTRDMAARWRMNLGLVSNLRAAVVRFQCSCNLLTAGVILIFLWNWLSWEQVFCTLLCANGVERKSTVYWL